MAAGVLEGDGSQPGVGSWLTGDSVAGEVAAAVGERVNRLRVQCYTYMLCVLGQVS